MRIATIIFGIFLSTSCFASTNSTFRPAIPERFLPSLEIQLNSESPIFIGMFGEVFSQRKNIGLVGKEIFGKSRPLKKVQFVQNLSDLGSSIPPEDVETAYKNYVTRWIAEAIAPFYFRAVLDLKAGNDKIDKKLINKFYWILFNRLPTNQSSSTDQISYLRHFVRENISFSFKPTREELKEVLGKTFSNDVVFQLDLSSLNRLSRNDRVEDEDFYKSWLELIDAQIEDFIKSLKRSLVISAELKKESEKDPMLLMNYFDEDQEFIYQQLTNVHRSSLKQMNYEATGLYVELSTQQKFSLQKVIDSGAGFEDVLQSIEDFGISSTLGRLRKFDLDELERKIDEELWNPIRVLQGRTTLVKIQGALYFVPNKINALGEFIFPLDSSVANKVVRSEINQRKKNYLLRKVSQRLSASHPLLLNFGKCYSELVFCLPENISDHLSEMIVTPLGDAPKDYLREYDLGILEKSVY